MIDRKDLISFLKNPSTENRIVIGSTVSFIKLIWISFLYLIIGSFIIALFITTPLSYLNLLPASKEYSPSFYNVLMTAMIVPIAEELIFRLPLIISKRNVSISLCVLIFFLLKQINIYLAFSASFLIALCLFFLFKSDFRKLKLLGSQLNNHYILFFYFQAIIFGALHISNYNLNFQYFYIFPFLILQYFFIGLIFGYVRVRFKNGIYVCIICHTMLNSIYCILYY